MQNMSNISATYLCVSGQNRKINQFRYSRSHLAFDAEFRDEIPVNVKIRSRYNTIHFRRCGKRDAGAINIAIVLRLGENERAGARPL